MYKLFVTKEKKLLEDINERFFIVISPNQQKDGSLYCNIEVFDNFLLIATLKGLICFYHKGDRLNLFQYLNNQVSELQSVFLGSYGLFTILENLEEYDKIRNFKNFKNILSAIKDVSYLNSYDRSERGNFYKFKNTEFFINDFLASKDRWKA